MFYGLILVYFLGFLRIYQKNLKEMRFCEGEG